MIPLLVYLIVYYNKCFKLNYAIKLYKYFVIYLANFYEILHSQFISLSIQVFKRISLRLIKFRIEQ